MADLVGFGQHVFEDLGEVVELVAHSAGCHIALAAAALAPVSRVVLWEPPDFNAKRVSPAWWQKLEAAAARGDRKAVVRLLLNDVVGANTGMHIPWFVFPVLFRSRFEKMGLANALASSTELRAYEAHEWHADDLALLSVPVYPMVRMEGGAGTPPQALVDAMDAHIGERAAKGVVLDGGGLYGTEEAVNFVVHQGEISRVDGPYAEAEEVVGGWSILQYDSLEEAVADQRELAELHAKYWPEVTVISTLRQISTGPDAPAD